MILAEKRRSVQALKKQSVKVAWKSREERQLYMPIRPRNSKSAKRKASNSGGTAKCRFVLIAGRSVFVLLTALAGTRRAVTAGLCSRTTGKHRRLTDYRKGVYQYVKRACQAIRSEKC